MNEKNNKQWYKYIIPVVLLVLAILACYKANWIFGDNLTHIATCGVDKYMEIHNIPAIGRFNILQDLEKNLILAVFHIFGNHNGLTPFVLEISLAVYFSLTVLCLYKLLKKENNNNLLFSICFISALPLFSTGFFRILLDFIFPENMILLFFSLFMLFFYKAQKTDKIPYYAISLISAVIATHYKEPVFGTFVVFAVTNLLFNWKNQNRNERIFHFLLIVNGIVFLLMFYFFCYQFTDTAYNEGRNANNILKFILKTLIKNPVIQLLFVFGTIRAYFIIFKKDRKHIFYDSTLFAGIAYSLAYFALKIGWDYYFTPSIILFLPSIAYWTNYLYRRKKAYSLAVFLPLLAILILNAVFSVSVVSKIYEARRETIPYFEELLQEHKKGKKFFYYHSNNIIKHKFNNELIDFDQLIHNKFLNYLNKSEKINFFTTIEILPDSTFSNALFFYSVYNEDTAIHQTKISKNIEKKLNESGFFEYSGAQISNFIFEKNMQ